MEEVPGERERGRLAGNEADSWRRKPGMPRKRARCSRGCPLLAAAFLATATVHLSVNLIVPMPARVSPVPRPLERLRATPVAPNSTRRPAPALAERLANLGSPPRGLSAAPVDAVNKSVGAQGPRRAAGAGLPACNNTFLGAGRCLHRRPPASQDEWARFLESGSGDPDDVFGLTWYGCMGLMGGRQVSERGDASAVPWCLDGSASWGACQHGEWLCEAAYIGTSRATLAVVDTAMVLSLPESTLRFEHMRAQFLRLNLSEPFRLPATRITPPPSPLTAGSASPPDLSEQELQRILGPFFKKEFQFRGCVHALALCRRPCACARRL